MIIVFTYNRLEMLRETVKPLKGEKYTIIDDGSDHEEMLPNTIKIEHQGRAGFIDVFNFAFEICKNTDDDFFMFMPDDYTEMNIPMVRELFEQFKGQPFIYNMVKDQRESCFMPTKNFMVDDFTENVGFTDCGFFTNRATMELLKWKLNPTSLKRFMNPARSSGVGEQLTIRLNQMNVPMYRPGKSLAFHGEHESVMHPVERKKNKLTSL